MKPMTFSLPDLPYPYEALEPHMSADTLHYHHDKHHKKYLDTLNEMIASGPHSDKSLEEIILASAGDDDQKKLFNNAAQVRSEEHTSELQSLMRISYAVFCLKKKKQLKTSM